MVIVDCAIYDTECAERGECPLEQALEAARSSPDTFVWSGLHRPTEEEFAAVVEEFQLHPLAVEDAVDALPPQDQGPSHARCGYGPT